MKKLFTTIMLVACVCVAAHAQTSLTGRVYHHPNIMADAINDKSGEIDKKMAEVKAEEFAKAEKKKGRALTADEKAKIEADVAEGRKMTEVIMKSMKTAITATFKSDTELVMKIDMELDEEALKKAGIGWAQRKMMKAAMSAMPSTEKVKYTVQGNLIICIDGKEKDTLTVSADGKYLSGKMDEKTKFKLTRTK